MISPSISLNDIIGAFADERWRFNDRAGADVAYLSVKRKDLAMALYQERGAAQAASRRWESS